MISINGNESHIDGEINIYKLLEDNKFDTSKVAVILNDDIVSKSDYRDKLVRDGDSLEVVSFVGGG